MEKSLYLLQALLQKYNSQDIASVISYLPKNAQQQLTESSPLSQEVLNLNFAHWVNEIHYSWLIPFIENLNPSEQQLLKKSLNKKQKKGFLSHHNKNDKSYSPAINFFFHSFLAEKFSREEKDLLPPQLLPPSSLKDLFQLDKAHMIKIITLLGIHDLAAELRHILDRTLLEKVNRALSPVELQFLKYCSNLTIKWTPPKMDLHTWDGDPKVLHALLHRRGLYRFARCLSDEHPNFIWHICHRLDIGRGKAIYKILSSKKDSNFVPLFKEQVIYILNSFKNRPLA